MQTVVASVHQAIDALTIVAKTDGAAVEAASAAGRLHMPTRSLPAEIDAPRPFAPALITRCEALRDRYGVALDATVKAARAIDRLALATRAPSMVLALARAAASAQTHPRVSKSRPDADAPGGLPSVGTPFSDSHTSTGRAGPVERAIRDRGVHDPVILLQAAAIDNAASRLIAGPKAQHPSSPRLLPLEAGAGRLVALQGMVPDVLPAPSPTRRRAR